MVLPLPEMVVLDNYDSCESLSTYLLSPETPSSGSSALPVDQVSGSSVLPAVTSVGQTTGLSLLPVVRLGRHHHHHSSFF